MSSSKADPKLAAAEDRRPKCTRCRHHGIIVPQKGHMKNCLFLQCTCWKCYLVSQRTRITALLRSPKTGQDKEERPGAATGGSRVKPASEARRSGPAPSAGAGPSATSGSIAADPAARSPLDLRSKPPAGGEAAAGGERGERPRSEESPAAFSPPYLGDFEVPPVPVVRLPWPGHPPASSYAPSPNFMLNMLWFPPAPPGFYNNNSLRGSIMLPHFQPVAAHPLSAPGPEPADSRRLVFTLQPPPELFQPEVMALHHAPDTHELK